MGQVVLLVLAVLVVWSRSAQPSAVEHRELGQLPRSYWLPWLLTVSVIGLEFFVVVWGGSLVAAQTGESLADATLTVSAFIAGMIAGRAVMSMPVAASSALMLRPSLPIIRPFISSLGSWTTETVRSAT